MISFLGVRFFAALLAATIAVIAMISPCLADVGNAGEPLPVRTVWGGGSLQLVACPIAVLPRFNGVDFHMAKQFPNIFFWGRTNSEPRTRYSENASDLGIRINRIPGCEIISATGS